MYISWLRYHCILTTSKAPSDILLIRVTCMKQEGNAVWLPLSLQSEKKIKHLESIPPVLSGTWRPANEHLSLSLRAAWIADLSLDSSWLIARCPRNMPFTSTVFCLATAYNSTKRRARMTTETKVVLGRVWLLRKFFAHIFRKENLVCMEY